MPLGAYSAYCKGRLLSELNQLELDAPRGLQRLLQGAARILQTEIDLAAEIEVPGLGNLQASYFADGN
ncbi:hypothetical protein [Sodalinema gerasimenkoae]|uniref:hypothetical protein n=1 Tax=Sodalinema gerasimenkoae TaxID=2862348 RepID=UPI0031B5F297